MSTSNPKNGGLEPMVPRITDYWDSTQDACNLLATRLAGLAGTPREEALTMRERSH